MLAARVDALATAGATRAHKLIADSFSLTTND
jgi:hypothetical protein